ncbi:metal ABC transporter permease [Corynebacterium caspium]|uniref:metal ABC transporter permease n=1 Tax=Corynebacterium caspium TaxID=234828 RepID=UPI0003759796|nr:metal ABC transporter permease [Corynebacterium caspium]WKD59570.1 Manganese transport system membrane protein MntB [Corynebacterium caspium DSM 44850]
MSVIFEPLTYSFVTRALGVASITAIVAGILSCWLILIGWSLLGDAVSHAVLPGVVISYIIGIPFAIGALVAALLAVWLVNTVRDKSTLRPDTSIGVIFTALFALGLVLISVTPSGTNLHEILFGNLLGITQKSLYQVILFGGIAFALMMLRRRDITLWAFDFDHARTIGLNIVVIRWTMLLCLALTVVAAMQAVGVILVVAMLVTPGATAYLLTQRFRHMMWISPLVAWLSCLCGIWSSYFMDVSTGGMIVLTQAFIFALAWLFAPREGIITTKIRRRSLAEKVLQEAKASA